MPVSIFKLWQELRRIQVRLYGSVDHYICPEVHKVGNCGGSSGRDAQWPFLMRFD